jgi:alpha-tubulin suppressor-like RCC1 family protein
MRHATRFWSSVLLVAVLGVVCSGAAGSFMSSSGRLAKAKAVTAGVSHTCALTRSGGVKCWGYNGHDELGTGSGDLLFSSTPLDVSSMGGGVTAISAGTRHSCALTNAGGVRCWGVNYGGALGDGTEDRHFGPVEVVGLGSGVKAVAAGYDRSCAVLATGAVKCWGTDYGLTPVDVPGLSSDVVAVSQRSFIGCALTSAGGVKCWGFHYGPAAVDVPGLGSGVKAVTTGGPLCALTSGGAVKCWGLENDWTPTDVQGLTSGVTALATDGGHGCALMSTGGVKCWGSNDHGQLGDGSTMDRLTPVDVAGLGNGVTAIAAGTVHSCAVIRTGGIRCWGANGGQLGDGTTKQRTRPVNVVGFGVPPARCVVPNVVGKKLSKARAGILHGHCRVGSIARVASARSRNVVVGQSPRAGKQLKAGFRVALKVSRGA